MKPSTLYPLVLVLLAIIQPPASSFAQSVITATYSVTNSAGTTNGNTAVIQGTTYLWTNSPNSLSQITNASTPTGAATNLYNKLLTALTNRYMVKYGSSTSVVLRTYVGQTITAGISTNWGTLVYSTNTAGNASLGASNLHALSITLGGTTIDDWTDVGAASVADGSLTTNKVDANFHTLLTSGGGGGTVQTNISFAGVTNLTSFGALTNNETRAVTFREGITSGTVGGFPGSLALHDGASTSLGINYGSGTLNIGAPIVATAFSGDGSSLTALAGSAITPGTISSNKLDATAYAAFIGGGGTGSTNVTDTAIGAAQVTNFNVLGTLTANNQSNTTLSVANAYFAYTNAGATFDANGKLTSVGGVNQAGLANGSYGPLVVASPASIYGASGTRIGINTNVGPAIDAFGSYTRYLSDVNGARFYNQNATIIGMELSANGTLLLPSGNYVNPQTSGGIVGAGQQPFGASVQSRLGVMGGDASGLASLPSSGHDIWHHGTIQQPQVYITGWWNYGTNYGATQITNDIQTILTNGTYAALTNRGLRPTVMIDAAWMQRDRIGGMIVVNSNLYPSGMVAFKKFVNSKGFLLEGGIYYVGTLTNSEFVGILGNSASTANPSDMKVAASTPLTISKDVNLFYSYFDSIRVADYQPANGIQQTAGHQLQSIRQWSHAVKYPGGVAWTKEGYTNRLGLSWFMGESPHLVAETAISINALAQDQFVVDRATPVSTAAYGLRFNHTNTSWAIGKGHFMAMFIVNWNQGTLDDRASAITNGTYWSSLITAGALHSATFQMDNNTPNEAFWALTNSAVMDVYFDPEYHPAWMNYDDGRNSVWVKPLKEGNYAVAMFNQSTTNRDMSFGYSDFNPPTAWNPIQKPPQFKDTNQVMKVFNIWAKTNFGFFDSGFTATVPASNFLFFKVSPVWSKECSFGAEIHRGDTYALNPDVQGDSPYFISAGFRSGGAVNGSFSVSVPRFTTNVTMLATVYAGAAVSAWTNTISPQYIGGTTRFFSSGGVSQTTVPVIGSNTGLSNVTISCTFPSTNANKWVVVYLGLATNSVNRMFLDSLRLICE